jgi:hemoglobin/transferrin/lactoferrin receptor protein
VENVKVWGFTIDGRKTWGNHELSVGADGQLNDLESTATRTNLTNGNVTKLDTRYPDGENSMNYFAVYAQHLYKFSGGKFVLNDGIRLQAVRLKSTISDNSFFNLPVTEVEQNSEAVTGNIGLIYNPGRNTKIALSLASGFRAPNIDDLAKVFESSTSARQVVVPNTDLKPEYTYNIDLSITHIFAEKVKVELSGFHTWFRNAIVKAPFGLNGQDSITYNGVRSQVLASQNRNKAQLYGFSARIDAAITDHLSASASVNYTRGRFEVDPKEASLVFMKRANGTYIDSVASVSSKPLDHIPPVFGRAALNYEKAGFNTELSVIFNGWKRIKDFNADGEDNAQYAAPNGYVPRTVIPDGFPAWYTLNWRGSYTFGKSITLQVAVENILDRNYRYFASGFSAAGRNFIFAVRKTI